MQWVFCFVLAGGRSLRPTVQSWVGGKGNHAVHEVFHTNGRISPSTTGSLFPLFILIPLWFLGPSTLVFPFCNSLSLTHIRYPQEGVPIVYCLVQFTCSCTIITTTFTYLLGDFDNHHEARIEYWPCGLGFVRAAGCFDINQLG